MILDRRQSRWALTTAVAAALALGAYIVYVSFSDGGARGGSFMGLFFAALGTAVIVFECLLGLRKRYPASPFGRVKTWLTAHVWLGLLSFVLILMHSGFRWGDGLAAVLMWMFVAIAASGVFGVAMQHYLPRRMTEVVTRETIYEQIPTVVRKLRMEADQRVEFITADLAVDDPEPEYVHAGGVKRYFDPSQKKSAADREMEEVQKRKASPQIEVDETSRETLRAHYLQEIRPFLTDRPVGLSRKLFSDRDLVAAYFGRLRIIMPVAAHDVLRDIESICEERRQLSVQRRLHLWLHLWMLVHVPLSFAFLVVVAVHAVLSLRY